MSSESSNKDDALPQYDLGEIKTDIGFFKNLFHLRDLKEERVIPAQVVKYQAQNELADVIPLVQFTKDTINGEKNFDRPTYNNVPVMHFGNAQYFVSVPCPVGSTGLLVALDRNCVNALTKNYSPNVNNNQGPQPADDCRLLSFENGVFIPLSFTPNQGNWKVVEDSIDMVISNPNGGSYISKFSLRKDGIYYNDKKFTGGGGMNLICGDYSNITFTDVTEGSDAGKVKIDVFYV